MEEKLVRIKSLIIQREQIDCAFRRSRPPIPTDRDHLFRSIATSGAGANGAIG